MTRPNVFETPIEEMNINQVNEAIEQLTAWAEEWGWNASEDDSGHPTAREELTKLIERLDQLEA